MIDDELLQELLVRATGLYNNGDYKGAIAAWREALEVDPSSQKAREGIQMATLLLADWEPTVAPADAEPARPADGAAPGPSARPEADALRIDLGVKRVRGLILERKYSEAIEGARGLVPIDPDSEEVQQLVEEAQQAFESAPFIDEHLTLAQELLDQGRRAEADAECRKVFALDPANPDAHKLLATIQGKQGATPEPPPEPAGDLGGRTMRIDRSQLQAFQARPEGGDKPRKPVADEPAFEAAEPDPEPIPITDLSAAAGGPSAVENETGAHPATDAAGAKDFAGAADVAGEAEPELDFQADDSLEVGAAGAALPVPEIELELEGLSLDEPLEIPAPDAGTAGPVEDEAIILPDEPPAGIATAAPDVETIAAPAADEAEVIEATTVVPPSVRLVERSAENQAELDRLMNQLDEDPEAIESIPLAIPAAAPAPAGPPAARRAAAAPASARPDAGWEKELESLNQKSGAHEIVGRSAARTSTPEAAADEDVDLTALMGDEIGPLQAPAEAQDGPPAEVPRPAPAPPPIPDPMLGVPLERPQRRERSAARLASMSPPAVERRARVTTSLFAIGGLVILAVAAVVWWFFFQPRNATGRSQPPTAAAPPSASSGAANGSDSGSIPTPIGSTSKQSDVPAHQGGTNGGGSADTSAAPAVQETGPAANAPSGSQVAPSAAPKSAAAATPPIDARPRTAEEIRRETAQHFEAGKAYLAAERWAEARRELAAALALDPVNFECKTLLEQAQTKVDQETKVRAEYDEARRLFQDKDYQGALWKLYRLPKDARFGDLDVPIRNAWYNWAVVALKGGDATTATQKLNEVFQVDPADADAEKMMKVAAQYASRPKDRGFYSFVDTLHFRSFDGR